MATELPKYIKVANFIKGKIQANELKDGEKLYSENQLSSMFSMSRQTVRRGVDILEQEGLVERIQGSGTYIRHNRINRQKTLNIAVVTTYVDRYIFPNLIREIEKVVSKVGFFTQIAFTYNTIERETLILQSFLDNNVVDGIIMEPTKSSLPNPNIKLYEELEKKGIPIVFINSYYPDLDLPYVCMNDQQAGLLAAKYLINAGHTRIGGIFKADDRQGHFRYSGFIKGMLDEGLKIDEKNIIWIDTEDINQMEYNEERILNRLEGCTGCVCYNDEVAVPVIKMCNNHNINVPEQLSIVSIDDSDLAEGSEVPLTSVAYPIKELGEKAAKNLLHLIDDNNFNASHEFSPKITVRDSVKRI